MRLALGKYFVLLGMAAASAAFAETVTIEIPRTAGIENSAALTADLRMPEGPQGRVPAVVILHAAGGIDGASSSFVSMLNQAGMATLEVKMFARGGAILLAGEKDQYDDADSCLRFVNGLPTDAKALYTVVVYPGAYHGWNATEDRQINDPAAYKGRGGRVGPVRKQGDHRQVARRRAGVSQGEARQPPLRTSAHRDR